MDKGNVDKHRRSMSGVKAQETEKWGRDTARERYGSLKYQDGAPMPKDTHAPQKLGDRNNLQGPNYQNMTADDWRRGNGTRMDFTVIKPRIGKK